MSDVADVNLTVTGATGTISLSAGSHTGALIDLQARTVATPFSSSSFIPATVDAGKGGSAAVTASGNVNLNAKGAVTLNAGASGDLTITAGNRLASRAVASASSGGKATVNAQAGTNINGGTVTLTAGDNISITGASNIVQSAGVHAKRNGVAAITAQDGTTIVSKGALNVTAGHNLTIYGGGTNSSSGLAARSASVTASSGGAHATLTVTDGVRLTAASIGLKAVTGDVSIYAAASAGKSAVVHAGARNDEAVLNVDDGIAINATGAITAKAGGSLSIGGGAFTGKFARVTAGSLAAASMDATAGVDIKAGGLFKAKALNGDLSISAGFAAGFAASASAHGRGTAAFNADSGVNITAGAINLSAASVATAASPGNGSLFIGGGKAAGFAGGAFGNSSGHAAYSAVSTVNLDARGAIAISAKAGNLTLRAGGLGFSQNALFTSAGSAMHASADSGAVAKATTDSSINIQAGGGLGLNAKGNIEVSGGYGEFAIVNSILGSASVALNSGVNLNAKGALTATAGGNLTLHGGSEAGIGADMFLTTPTSAGTLPPGVINGSVNSGVSLSAGGAVTLTAGGNLTVAAGNGETLAVGKARLFPLSPSTSSVIFMGANQHSWGGGSANLSADLGVAVTAGTSLTVTAGAAGTGSLQVLGLGKNPGSSQGFKNIVSVRGGSSHAVANLSLNGNATLTAGTDMLHQRGGQCLHRGRHHLQRACRLQ